MLKALLRNPTCLQRRRDRSARVWIFTIRPNRMFGSRKSPIMQNGSISWIHGSVDAGDMRSPYEYSNWVPEGARFASTSNYVERGLSTASKI